MNKTVQIYRDDEPVEGEPYFVLRGSDPIAADALSVWCRNTRQAGQVDPVVIAEVQALSEEMRAFLNKTPDRCAADDEPEESDEPSKVPEGEGESEAVESPSMVPEGGSELKAADAKDGEIVDSDPLGTGEEVTEEREQPKPLG